MLVGAPARAQPTATVAPTPFLTLVQTALAVSPNAQIPSRERAIAALDLQTARRRASALGTIDAAATATLHQPGVARDLGPSITAQYAILDGGLRAAEAAIARIEGRQADQDARIAALTVFTEAGSAYDALWLAQQDVRIVSGLKARVDRDLQTLRNANRAGIVGEIDVDRAAAQSQAEATVLFQAQSDERLERAVLNVLLNRSAASPLVVLPDLGLTTPPFTDATEAIDAAAAANPQALLDELAVASAQAAVDEQRAALRPTLTLAGSTSYDLLNPVFATTAAGVPGLGAGAYRLAAQLGIGFSQRLFDFGVTRRAIARAELQQSISSLTLDQERQSLATQAASAYYTWQQSIVNVRSATAQEQLDARIYTISRRAQRAGETSYFEVASDEQALFNAQVTTVAAQEAQSNALLALEEVTATLPLDRTLQAAGIEPYTRP